MSRDIRRLTFNHVQNNAQTIGRVADTRAVRLELFDSVQEKISSSKLRKSGSGMAAARMVAKGACDHITSSFSMSNGASAIRYNLEVFKGHAVHLAGVATGSENCLSAYGIDANDPRYQNDTCGREIANHFSDFRVLKAGVITDPVPVCGTRLHLSHDNHLQSDNKMAQLDSLFKLLGSRMNAPRPEHPTDDGTATDDEDFVTSLRMPIPKDDIMFQKIFKVTGLKPVYLSEICVLTGLGTNPVTGEKAQFIFAAEYTLLQKLDITIVDQQSAVAALSLTNPVLDRAQLSKIPHCNSFDITHNVMDAAARAIPAFSKPHRAIGVNRAAELVFGSDV